MHRVKKLIAGYNILLDRFQGEDTVLVDLIHGSRVPAVGTARKHHCRTGEFRVVVVEKLSQHIIGRLCADYTGFAKGLLGCFDEFVG